MLKKFVLLFVALVISTTIAENLLIAGTWQYLFMQSISLSIIIFFIYHYIVFTVKHQQTDKNHVEQPHTHIQHQKTYNHRLLKKDK
ncbi:hypothetical protein [Staphylococcus hyicus]|uniref:hypothetical protein n=1 Tax=Staphylococcus hyicus TaxID=1284 RepID=UPI00057D23DE|nr:hypothetical protein [Staphylococcus hyicus]AJC95282.1 hypothetical protein SHYC_02385 [Staphylococcus hyicus]RTX66799.1 hypothetical protein EKQ60_09160 [Staphylococcus hyicus]